MSDMSIARLPGGDPLVYGRTPQGSGAWGLGPVAVAPDGSQPVHFSDASNDFATLLVKGAFLELVTFGFYRFWLVTAMRRHLWSATAVGRDAVEYTGRARELLIGFLLALTIIGPLAIVNFLLGIYAEKMQAFASVPLALFYFAFSQFASYRARRYRLTRTVWRGVRFWMQGSGWRYAWTSFWWGCLVVLSVGFALPWRAAALERYKMGNTFYGDLQGSFVGTGNELFKRIWWLWLMLVIQLVAIAVVFLVAVLQADNRPSVDVQWELAVAFGVLLLFFIPCCALAYPVYRAVEWKWWLSSLRFGSLGFTSGLKRRSVLLLYVKTVLVSIGVSILVGLVLAGSVALARYASGSTGSDTLHIGIRSGLQFGGYGGLAIGAVSYLVVALTYLAVQRYFLLHHLWRLITQTLVVTGISAADNVAAKGVAATALGEGLADGFDVAGF